MSQHMKSKAKPMSIPLDLAVRCDRPDQAERMDNLFRAVISIPSSAVLKEETKWKRAQAKKRGKKASVKPAALECSSSELSQ